MYYSIFAWNGLIHLQASPCWHKNGLACTDSMLLYKPAWLAYGQHADQGVGQCVGELMLAQNRHQDGQWGRQCEYIRLPLQRPKNFWIQFHTTFTV